MGRSPKKLLLASSLAAVVFAPCFEGSAHAQVTMPLTPYPACTSKPTAQDVEAAHSAYLLGKRFFEESDYTSASHNFIDSFKLDCSKPELLLNIARANELLGNRAEAVHALETYLARATTLGPDDKTQLQRRIDNLKAAMAAQAPVVTAPVVTAPPVPTTPPPVVPPPPPPPAEERGHTPYPWVVFGIGGAAAIAGGAVFLVGLSKESSADCPTSSTCKTPADKSNAQSGAQLKIDGSIPFWAGLAVAGGGLLWHFLEPTGPVKPESTKASFAPVVGPGFGGASVVGSF